MTRPSTASPRQVRAFGLVILAASALVAWRAARHHGPTYLPRAVLGAGALVAVVALVAPAAARPLYRAWMALGQALGRLTTPVLLTVVFALVFVPLRVLLALVGRDPLTRKRDPRAASYWSERSRRTFAREDFERLS